MERTIPFKDFVSDHYGNIKSLYADIRSEMPVGITYETFCQWITKETRPNKNTRGAYMAAREWLEAKHDITFVDGLMGWCIVKEKSEQEKAYDALLHDIENVYKIVGNLYSKVMATSEKFNQPTTIR